MHGAAPACDPSARQGKAASLFVYLLALEKPAMTVQLQESKRILELEVAMVEMAVSCRESCRPQHPLAVPRGHRTPHPHHRADDHAACQGRSCCRRLSSERVVLACASRDLVYVLHGPAPPTLSAVATSMVFQAPVPCTMPWVALYSEPWLAKDWPL